MTDLHRRLATIERQVTRRNLHPDSRLLAVLLRISKRGTRDRGASSAPGFGLVGRKAEIPLGPLGRQPS